MLFASFLIASLIPRKVWCLKLLGLLSYFAAAIGTAIGPDRVNKIFVWSAISAIFTNLQVAVVTCVFHFVSLIPRKFFGQIPVSTPIIILSSRKSLSLKINLELITKLKSRTSIGFSARNPSREACISTIGRLSKQLVFSRDNPALARKARQIGLGRKRAAIWRALGFSNLVKARAALAKKRAAAKQHAAAAA